MGVSMMEQSCRDFAEALAAKKPIPGGGAAAAYTGAAGVALCSMAGNFTLGKEHFVAVEDDVKRMLVEGEEIQSNLLALLDKDAAAFEPLSRAYGIPTDDPDRAEILEVATKAACIPPLKMMKEIAKALDLLSEMGQKGSHMLISDVGCGALLCGAALEAASMNVFVNTKALNDHDWALNKEKECTELLDTYVPQAQKLAASVMKDIQRKG